MASRGVGRQATGGSRDGAAQRMPWSGRPVQPEGALRGVTVPLTRLSLAMDLFGIFIVLAIIAVVAALLGFGGVAGVSKQLAKWALIAAVILFVVGFLLRG